MNSGGEVEIPLKTSRTEALRIKLLDAVIHNCPAHFVIAFAANAPTEPTWRHRWRAAAGRALDRQNARDAAVWEAIERASSMTGGPNDPRVDSRSPLPGGIPTPEDFWQYSSDQLHNLSSNKHYTARIDCGKTVDKLWVDGQHLLRRTRHALPATATFLEEDRRLGLGTDLTSSTGTAARDDLEGAEKHAVLERVERDAVAIWWYNQLPAPRLEGVHDLLPQQLAAWLDARRRITWHLLIPHDLPVTTIVTLSARRDGSRPAIGAAASTDAEHAVLSATLEMLQGEIALSQMRAADHAGTPPALLAWSDTTNAFAKPELAGQGSLEAPVGTPYDGLLDALDAGGIDVYLADLTHPELGFPVIKALSPHLRDWQPRFAPGRLYDVPVRLGLKPVPTPEHALNPVAFVI